MLIAATPKELMTPRRHGAATTPQDDRVCAEPAISKRIAIVEDQLMVAWTIETMVEELGHEVAGIFANGEDAVLALQSQAVDLVCMDINLGRGIDGIETARLMVRNQAVAILFISAYCDESTKMKVAESVPGALLVGKPIALEALKRAIEEVSRTAN